MAIACGDDDSAEGSPTATLRIHTGTVEVQGTAAAAFVPATDGQVLTEGAAVRTGPDGRAILEWPDGSITRLDFDTVFRISELRAAATLGGGSVEAEQDSGASYNRVVALTETGSRFSVVTPTAAASVQGTTYAVVINPDGSTTVIVTDGTVVVTTVGGEEVIVEAGFMVTIGADGSIDGPTPIPDDVLNSEWMRFNETCDAGTCPVTIGAGPVASIAISPTDATIDQGESQAYTAEGFDDAGTSAGQVEATYDLDEIPCDGSICTPAAPGDYTVTATFDGFSATANLTVLATGDIQVTLDWDVFVDLDLWVSGPDGEIVKFNNPEGASGGRLDRDAYADCEFSAVPPENTVWDTTAPSGEYEVTVHVYDICAESAVGFELTVSIGGEVILVVDDVVLTATDETYEVSFEKP